MKLNIETVLPVMLALLIMTDLAFHGVTKLAAAPSVSPGIHMQNPKLDPELNPELVRKTKEDTDKVIQGTNGQNCHT